MVGEVIKEKYAFGWLAEEKIFIHFSCGVHVEGKPGSPAFSQKKLKNYRPKKGEQIMAVIVEGQPNRKVTVWAPFDLWDLILNEKPSEDVDMKVPEEKSATLPFAELPPVAVEFNLKDKHTYRVVKKGAGGRTEIVSEGKMAALVQRIIDGKLITAKTWLMQDTPKGWARVSTYPFVQAFTPIAALVTA